MYANILSTKRRQSYNFFPTYANILCILYKSLCKMIYPFCLLCFLTFFLFFILSLSYLALLPFSLPLLNRLSSPYLICAPVLFESIFLIKSAQTILFRYFCCLLTRFPYKKRASYCIYQKVFVTLRGFSNSKLLLIHN